MKGTKTDSKNTLKKIRPYFILLVIILTLFSATVYLFGDFKNSRSGLNMSHKSKVEDIGLDCTDCHTVNKDNPRLMTFPDHETCSMCHFDAIDETSEDKDCGLCHNKPGEETHTRKNMVLSPLVIFNHQNHQEVGKVACLECHEKIMTDYDVYDPEATLPDMADCIECHKERGVAGVSDCMSCHFKGWEKTKPMSHNASWEKTHGLGLSREEIASNCTTCHNQKLKNSCTDCHHKKEMRLGKVDYCGNCHISGFDTTRPKDHTPFWTSNHGRGLTRSKIETCNLCHTVANNNDCQSCHRREAPKSHTIAFRARSHGNMAMINREACATCHSQSECISCHTTVEPTSHTGLWGSTYSRHCYHCHNESGDYSNVSVGSNCTFCHMVSEINSEHTSLPRPGGHAASGCTGCHTPTSTLFPKVLHPYDPADISCLSCHL